MRRVALCLWRNFKAIEEEESLGSTMWQKLKQSTLGDEEDRGESFFNDESEGLCALSPTQVPWQKKISQRFHFHFRVCGICYF